MTSEGIVIKRIISRKVVRIGKDEIEGYLERKYDSHKVSSIIAEMKQRHVVLYLKDGKSYHLYDLYNDELFKLKELPYLKPGEYQKRGNLLDANIRLKAAIIMLTFLSPFIISNLLFNALHTPSSYCAIIKGNLLSGGSSYHTRSKNVDISVKLKQYPDFTFTLACPEIERSKIDLLERNIENGAEVELFISERERDVKLLNTKKPSIPEKYYFYHRIVATSLLGPQKGSDIFIYGRKKFGTLTEPFIIALYTIPLYFIYLLIVALLKWYKAKASLHWEILQHHNLTIQHPINYRD